MVEEGKRREASWQLYRGIEGCVLRIRTPDFVVE